MKPKLPKNLKATTRNGIRVFDMTVSVDAYPGPTFDEWPSNIQDGVLQVMETASAALELPLAMVDSRADKDIDAPLRDGKEVFYIHVVFSEVVMGLPEQATLH